MAGLRRASDPNAAGPAEVRGRGAARRTPAPTRQRRAVRLVALRASSHGEPTERHYAMQSRALPTQEPRGRWTDQHCQPQQNGEHRAANEDRQIEWINQEERDAAAANPCTSHRNEG